MRQRLGIEPEVISGDQEAELSFVGAAGSLAAVIGPVAAMVVDIGCVRLTERRLHSDPATPAEIAAAVADIDRAIDQAAAKLGGDMDSAARRPGLGAADVLVGVAGSVTTIAAYCLGLSRYDATATHGCMLTAARVHDARADLVSMTRRGRAAVPVIHPGRVDVIGGGALVLDRIMARAGADSIIVSEHDILDGIALSLV